MIPGMGKIDPRQMKAMMKQMGIQQDDIEASEVIIIKNDGSKIRIENHSIQKITMQGQSSFQVAGEIKEESAEKFSESDVKLVAEKTGASEDKAKEALEESNGDIAEAIMKLSE